MNNSSHPLTAMMWRLLLLYIALIVSLSSHSAAYDFSDIYNVDDVPYSNYSVVFGTPEWSFYSDSKDMLSHYFGQLADERMMERKHDILSLKTETDWKQRQVSVRNRLLKLFGPFPDHKSDLNIVFTGNLTGPDFTVRKMYFESLPKRFVSAALFIPDSCGIDSKCPAVLFASGHAAEGYRHDDYQKLILNLASKGFVVLAFDPIGEGERKEYIGELIPTSPVLEHQQFGKQFLVDGVNSGMIFVYDAMRALDTLLEQSVVSIDENRIAMCGNSGGGTQTAYTMAIDERIAIASPAGYIVGFHRLMETSRLQDAEQIWYRGWDSSSDFGPVLDHADLIEVRAPRPTLVIGTTCDQIFSIQGVREVVAEARAAYNALGSPLNLEMHEADDLHGYDVPNREKVMQFFMEHFNVSGNHTEMPIKLFTEESLWSTPLGNVLESFKDAKRTFDFIQHGVDASLAEVATKRENIDAFLASLPSLARDVSGYVESSRMKIELGTFPIYCGTLPRLAQNDKPDFKVEKWLLEGESSTSSTDLALVLPLLIFRPNDNERSTVVTKRKVVLYLNPEGKNNANVWTGSFVEKLVRMGYIVAVPDLSGLGEVGDAFVGSGSSYDASRIAYAAFSLGRSVVGLHAADIQRVADYMKGRSDFECFAATICHSVLCEAMMHHSTINANADMTGRLFLLSPTTSYSDMATKLKYRTQPLQLVPDVLSHYDIPDLVAFQAKSAKPVDILAPTNAQWMPASAGMIESEYSFPRKVYESGGIGDIFKVVEGPLAEDTMLDMVLDEL